MLAASTAAPLPFVSIVQDEYPVVQFLIGDPPKDIADITVFQQEFLALLQRARDSGHAKLCILMTLDGLWKCSPEQQMRAASFLRDVQPFVSTSIFCTALVITQPLARAVLTLVTALYPLKSMHRVFETYEDALDWTGWNADRQAHNAPAQLEEDNRASGLPRAK